METEPEIKDNELDGTLGQNGIKQWFQDNLRVLISVAIVILIAGGIYSYSKRTETPLAEEETKMENDLIAGLEEAEESAEEEALSQKKDSDASGDIEIKKTEDVSSVSSSQETEKSFIQTAARGDSQTTLARAALANFLEKNSDSSLTPEHKIYIEDYLRKKVNYQGSIRVGTSVEFSKDLIQEGIAKAKTLNEGQLKNLHKYAVLVPSLS